MSAAATIEYTEYVRGAWSRFMANPARARAALDVVADREVERVLDVGCGAGQELFPFVKERGALGVGIDVLPEAGRVGRALFAEHEEEKRFVFLRAAAEKLPFAAESFDVVICRLALPYMNNRRTLREFARVLKRGGVLFLKTHHALFYLRELKQKIAEPDARMVAHDALVLAAGAIYHLTGQQPRRIPIGETFQSEWLLRRELARCGLQIRREMPDSERATPSFLIVKT